MDVAAETELFLATPPLTAKRTKIWCLDQKINLRGVHTDVALVEKTLLYIGEETKILTTEVQELTDNKVTSVNQQAVFLKHLQSLGVGINDLQATTVREKIQSGEVEGKALRLLEIRRDLSKTSTAKYQAFWERSRTDSRIHDTLLYHGASTGRWTGTGIQPQNFPRGTIKDTFSSCGNR